MFCYQIQGSIQTTMGIVTMVWDLDVKKQRVGSGTILSQSSCHAWHRAHNSWQSKPHIWENYSSHYIIIIIKPKIKTTQTINGQSSVGGGVDFLWLKWFHCEMKGIGIKWFFGFCPCGTKKLSLRGVVRKLKGFFLENSCPASTSR